MIWRLVLLISSLLSASALISGRLSHRASAEISGFNGADSHDVMTQTWYRHGGRMATSALYAKKNNLLDKPGWKRFRRLAKRKGLVE